MITCSSTAPISVQRGARAPPGRKHVGAVTFVQRSDSALRLNVHFHTLALDGVYVRSEAGPLDFHRLGEPTRADVERVAAWTHAGLLRVLARHGRSLEGIEHAPDPSDDGCAPVALADD